MTCRFHALRDWGVWGAEPDYDLEPGNWGSGLACSGASFGLRASGVRFGLGSTVPRPARGLWSKWMCYICVGQQLALYSSRVDPETSKDTQHSIGRGCAKTRALNPKP